MGCIPLWVNFVSLVHLIPYLSKLLGRCAFLNQKEIIVLGRIGRNFNFAFPYETLMKELIFASHNENKTKEIRALLRSHEIQSLADLNYHEEIAETGVTLAENAELKARTIFDIWAKPVFADDTGLIVPALNGEPGVYSARYAGEPANAEANMDKLLANLQGIENREAYFETLICYINAEGEAQFFSGRVDGLIAKSKKGDKGFGYDPIFLPEGEEISFAQMPAWQKNEMSHRARALASFIRHLQAK